MTALVLDERLLVVPPLDEAAPWPTLGPQVCHWIETNLVHGPGDLLGQPVRLDDEKRALIWRAYEVYPQKHPRAGRRRFKRVCVSLRKGSAKTEWAAWIAAAELSPEAPVRCIGWDENGEPIGGPVTDPYIPMLAYTEEQSEELAYGALRVILSHSQVRDQFDIGLERIVRRDGTGKAIALASSPDARDGARTTFSHEDETHRFTEPRLKAAHKVNLTNIPKRKLADAWLLETTTAPAPGQGSVAEATMEYARSVAEGKRQDADLFFFHRQAAMSHDLLNPEDIRAAVIEASGPVAEWSDIDSIVAGFLDPTADRAYLRRVWLNQLVRASDRAFDVAAWRRRARREYAPKVGTKITLGFDGARREDSTALIATEIETGYQWPMGIWEKPAGPAGEGWEVPELEVDAAVAAAFEDFEVWRMYIDPPYWETWAATWAGRHGEDRVFRWFTNRWRKMADCIRAYDNAMKDAMPEEDQGEATAPTGLTHNGDSAFERHVSNAFRMLLTLRDEKGERLWVIQKERHDSPDKIDAAVAGALSWEARRDAVAAGAGAPKKKSVYETRGLVSIGLGEMTR